MESGYFATKSAESDSDSELSVISSTRFAGGLHEDYWNPETDSAVLEVDDDVAITIGVDDDLQNSSDDDVIRLQVTQNNNSGMALRSRTVRR